MKKYSFQNVKDIIIVVALMTLIFLIAKSGIEWNETIKEMLTGVSISVLAAAITLVLFWNINSEQKISPKRLTSEIIEEIRLSNFNCIRTVERNKNLGEEFWINLIHDLSSCKEPVWFIGTKLSHWLKEPYNKPLKHQLKLRIDSMISGIIKSGDNRDYALYLLVNNQTWRDKWEAFINAIIEEAIQKRNVPIDSIDDVREACYKNISIEQISTSDLKYSLVKCSNRMVVTQYVSSGRSGDSPTMDIIPDSDIWKLYIDDMDDLKVTYKNLKLTA